MRWVPSGEKNLWNWSHRSSSGTCLSKLWMLSRPCEHQMNSCIWHHFENSPVPHQFSSVQSLSHVQLSATPWTAAHEASLSITNSQSLFKLMSIESVMPSNHLILCHPPLLLPSIFPSIRVFSNESVLHIRWPKYWSFSFSISPSDEYLGLISFRMDWLDLLAVQGTLKSLHQHHSAKSSILQLSVFFIVQLSHPYMTTGKTIDLTRRTFVGKVMSLLLNMLSRLVIAFLQRSKHLLISWLQSPSAVILESRKIKSVSIKIVGRNINNLRYGDDTTIMAESEEELKSLLMKVREESENVGLKLNIWKTNIMVFGSLSSWQRDGETMETVPHGCRCYGSHHLGVESMKSFEDLGDHYF